jgi:hypothetical protein
MHVCSKSIYGLNFSFPNVMRYISIERSITYLS